MFEQTFKNIDDILHKDAGCSSELDYVEQTSWILFLKYLDDLEKERRQFEIKRDAAWKNYDEAAKEIDKQKDTLIDEIEKKLHQKTNTEELFTIRWRIV